MKSVYIETSIPSYLTARPSTDVRAAAWQQITYQWWEEERHKYEIFISELVIAEADALHVAIAAIQRIDYLLTWNCRHINNAITKPIIRELCEKSGYACPEICTPLELISED